jgi:hypothetical protein
MELIFQVLAHTPWWVFLLFAFLVSRGVRAFNPAEVRLSQLALLPAVFIVWGLAGLYQRYGLDVAALALWLVAAAIGAAIGLAILRKAPLKADRARGIVYRPADFTVLPLILVAFLAKYSLAVMAAMSPDLAASAGFRVADIGVSGLFAGIFVGKFAIYVKAYLAE